MVGRVRQKTETFDLVIYWRAITKRKWMILGLGVAAAAAVAGIVSMMTPIYSSTATLLIEQNKAKIAPTEEVYGNVSDTREHFQTQAEILKARALAAKLVEKLNLTKHPDFDPRQAKPSTTAEIRKFVGLEAKAPVLSEDDIYKDVVGKVIGRMNVEPVRLSQLIRISFESPDPMTASIIANAMAETYIESDIEARDQMNQRASEWLGARLSDLKRNLEESEKALQRYRDEARIIETRGLAQSGATRQIEDLMTRLVAARQQRFAAESAYNQISGAKDRPDYLPSVLRNPLVLTLKESETEAEKRVLDLSNRFGPEHPRMIQAAAELKQARENTRRQIDAVVASIGNDYELTRKNEKALEQALAAAKTTVQSTNRKEFQLASLERAVATNRQIYELFLNRFRETRASRDLQSSAVARIADPARPSQTPVKPKKEQLISMALVFGILMGALIALMLERLENTLKSAEDVEEKLGQPMLTMLPLLRGAEAANVGRHYLEDPKSVFSESIRTARTGILLSANEASQMSLLVTSSVPGEGKTAIAVNLALAQSQTKRVLLIDGDLRRPSVGRVLGLDQAKPGLTNLLSGTATFAECLQRIDGSSLYAITSGPVPLNPLEMILSQRFQQLTRALAGTCDVLIIDSPPVHLVSDAVVLSRMVTGALFVVKADSTPYPLVRRCIRALEEVDARMFGVMLNQLDFKRASRYYGAYTGGYYKYDGYYTRINKPAERTEPVAALST